MTPAEKEHLFRTLVMFYGDMAGDKSVVDFPLERQQIGWLLELMEGPIQRLQEARPNKPQTGDLDGNIIQFHDHSKRGFEPR